MGYRPLFLVLPALLWQWGCSEAAKGPCDGLVYLESGLPRSQYLPCAREIMAALDQAERGLDAHYNRNDKDGRRQARSALRQAETLLRKAGGHQKMLAGWADEPLNDLNVDLWNAYFSYDAAVMVPNNPTDFNNGRRSHGSARNSLSLLY